MPWDRHPQHCHHKNSLGQEHALSIKDVRLTPNANISLLSASQLMADQSFEDILAPPAHLITPCGAPLPLPIARSSS